MTHPDESNAPGIEDVKHLRFTWNWDETGYHGDDLSELLNFADIDPQDAESILTSMEELRIKIQETIVLDIDELSAQSLLTLYNKLARAHRHVKKFAASSVEEMPYLQGTFATIDEVRRAVGAVRAPRV